MEHHFNIEIAKKMGIEEAVFLHNLFYWLHRNAANGKNFIDGSYWTYNTKQSYSELFPYMSYSKIKRIIDTLLADCIIKTGNFNENKMDRTLWYAFTECGLKIMQKAGYDVDILYRGKPSESKMENALVQNEPMEESKTSQCNTNINNTNINNKETLETSSRVKERLSHKYNKDKPLTDIEVKFYLGMEEKYPRVMRMDYPLKYSQYQQLLKDGISNKKIIANLEAMENWKILKDRVKAYNTLLTFLKKDRNEYPQEMA